MPFAIATLDAQPIFGLVTACSATPMPVARQTSAFFGTNGRLSIFGGTRGWTIHVSGVFEESDIPTLQADFAAIYSFAGPATHTYTDTKGNVFYNVIFDGQMTPDPRGPKPTDVGWEQPYTMTMESLL